MPRPGGGSPARTRHCTCHQDHNHLDNHKDFGSAEAVHDGQLGAAVDQELVGEARVVHVVDGRGEDGGHHLQWREHALSNRKYFLEMIKYFFSGTNLECGRVEKNVSGLSDVSAVHAVVIWNI